MKKIESSWKEFGFRKYFIRRIYESGSLTNESYSLIPCLNGGPFLRKRSRPSTFFDFILNNGRRAVSRDIKCSADIYACFWCQGGKIGILSSQGNINIYSISGELIFDISSITNNPIILAQHYFNGISFIDNKGNFMVFDYSLGRTQVLKEINITHQPVCMTFIKDDVNNGIVCLKDGSVLLVNTKECKTIRRLTFVPTTVKMSSNGQYVAVADSTTVSLFRTTSNEIYTYNSNDIFETFGFLDDNRILIISGSKLMMYGPSIAVEIPIPKPKLIVQDIDHARIYTENDTFIIVPVSSSISNLFKNPQFKIIFEAKELYERGSIECLEKLKSLEQINLLIDQMLEAALNLLDPFQQEHILAAVIFALEALELDKSNYINALKHIRMLNTLRSPEFGFTTTYKGLKTMSIPFTIEFAMEMKMFETADRMCALFDYNSTIVAQQWASVMFQIHGHKALGVVIGKLETKENVDYVAVTQAAKRAGLGDSSLRILADRIRNPTSRTLFLMDLFGTDPLSTAVSLMDGDAIIRAVFYMRETKGKEAFGKLLASNPEAFNHYALVKQEIDARVLMHVNGLDPLRAMQILMVHELPEESFGREPGQLYTLGKLLSPESLWRKLLFTQARMIENPEIDSSFSTPAEAVQNALLEGKEELAQKIAKKFKISPKRYAYLQVRAFAKERDWERVEGVMSATKNPPIPYSDVAEICFESGGNEAGLKFAKLIKPLEAQKEFFEKYGMSDKAAEVEAEITKMKEKHV